MKKRIFPALLACVAFSLLFLLSGCLKDSCNNTYKIFTPVFKTLTEVRAGIKSSAAQPLKNTGKIYVFGNYLFLNEVNKGIHVIDNTNPSMPRNFSFINIPGNVDIAVKGNYLYADCYSDIVVLDISNPTNVAPVQFIDNALPENGWFWANHSSTDSVQVVVDYIERDTTVDCSTWERWKACANCAFMDAGGRPAFTRANIAAAAPVQTGKGGSMARFTIAADFLYGVTGSRLHAFSLANAADPQRTNITNVGWGIETVYPFKDKLFIGSTTGMFIYDITNPSTPVAQGRFTHANSCDPVVADDKYAYVTLRSGTTCQGFTNQLEVVDITNLNAPSLLKTYPMTNPHGLSKEGNLLFICDGKGGLKLYNAANPANILPVRTITGLEAYDVITNGTNAIVVAKDGIYQYDFSNANNIQLRSKLSIVK